MRGGHISDKEIPKSGSYICGSIKAPDNLLGTYVVVKEDQGATSVTRATTIANDDTIKVLYKGNETLYFGKADKVPVDRSILVKPEQVAVPVASNAFHGGKSRNRK